MVSGTVSLLAFSTATGQQDAAVSDALIVRDLAPELGSVQLGRIQTLSERSRSAGSGFRFEHDLNSDGQQELVLLGNYAKGERRQSFVLIARPAAGGQWVRSRLFTFDEEFVVGRRYEQYNDRLALFFCTNCDYGGWIEWTGSDYEYRRFPLGGPPAPLPGKE
jgi:hypothetical protein